MDLAKTMTKEWETPERQQMLLREPQLKKLAHIPLLTLFYLTFQRRFSATPVTPLELSAYLGMDVVLAEGLLASSAKKGWVKVFKEGMPAYTLVKDLEQISVHDLVEWIGEIQEMMKIAEVPATASSVESQEKYRKIYSELASEMLQLFGEEAVNKIPL